MKEYPSRIIVGIPPSRATYNLQNNQLLIHFKEDLEEERIEKFLDELKLKPLDRKTDTLRVAKVRWVEISDAKIHNLNTSLIETSRNIWKLPEVMMVTPVYYLECQDAGSAASPMTNTFVIRFKGKVDRKVINQLKDFGLELNRQMSQLLEPYYYFSYKIPEGDPEKSFEILNRVMEIDNVESVEFDWLKLVTYMQLVPNDTFWANQWNLTRINLPNAWVIETGNANVWVAIIDSGFDLTHPDINFTPNTGTNLTHFNADQALAGNPAPYDASSSGVNHGTCVAGIAAATINNAVGVAGVAGGASIMPVRLGTIPTSAKVAAGINWAANNGALVANLSLGTTQTAAAITAVTNAWTAGMILCVATGNNGGNTTSPAINFPANQANVIAVGAVDQADQRKRPASADNECWWGSQFGAELDVMAPGVLCWTTDEQGANGYNQNGNPLTLNYQPPPHPLACLGIGGSLTYPTTGDAAGNYYANFNGTSAATPHVSGLAALLLSEYPTLTNQQVRDIIERTCEKVNQVLYPYAYDPNHPNGVWHQEMGYGRVNALQALDFADVLIKDWPGDTGVEPSTPPSGNYWDFSDIVIRPNDDNVFVPSDPTQSSGVERGQTNYLYIEVKNNGPREARNVVVSARITPYVGTSFMYPADWTLIDATHISPTPVTNTFAAIPSGGTVRAKFTISSVEVDSLWGWEHTMNWSPCLLAAVNADNDYAFTTANIAGGPLVRGHNNIAQKNLSIVDAYADATFTFPFVAGNRHDAKRSMELIINRSQLPKEVPLLLSLEDDGKAFPLVDFSLPAMTPSEQKGRIVFLERTIIETTLGCLRGVLTLEQGSKFECLRPKIGNVQVSGGEIILRDDKRFVEIREKTASIRIDKQPNRLYPFSLHTRIPATAKENQQFTISVAQRDEKEEIIGGATVIYIIK
jgi:subtilisin family serine protease